MRLQLEQAWIDDLKIHDVTAGAALSYSLRSAKKTIVPRRVEVARTNRHGITDRTKPLFSSAVYDLAGYVDAGSMGATEDAFDALIQRLAGEGSHTFRFRRLGRAEDEQALVTLGGLDSPQEGYSRTVRYAATVVAADPRTFSSTLKTSAYDPTGAISGGGVAMPLVMPLVFTTTTVTELDVVNSGNAPTPPVLTVTGPVASPIIDNATTGESIYLLYTLGAGETIVVDVAARTVKLNGAVRQDLFDASRSKWFDLKPGLTALFLRGSGMSAGATQLSVSYRDARW